jgi:hypothetical protein
MISLFGLAIFIGIILGLAVGIQALIKSTPRTRSVFDPDWQPPKPDPLPYARRNIFSQSLSDHFTKS